MNVLSYGVEPLQVYSETLSVSAGNVRDCRIMIHGGAWRDPNNTYKDFNKWISHLSNNGTSTWDYYSLDYRLSEQTPHPGQIEDVIEALKRIIADIKDRGNSIGQLVLCGHSVGATLICQLLEYKSSGLRDIVTGVVLMDGIYSIKHLVDTYPDYESFVLEEFGTRENAYSVMNIDNGEAPCTGYEDKDITLVYSNDDELLNWESSQVFIQWVRKEVKIVRGSFGKHNDVYESLQVADQVFD